MIAIGYPTIVLLVDWSSGVGTLWLMISMIDKNPAILMIGT